MVISCGDCRTHGCFDGHGLYLPDHNEPGVLFIGACDDGTPSNCAITDELLRNAADMKTDGNILPLPVLNIEKRALKGADMAQEERILIEKRRFKNLPFDIYPVPSAQINNLSKSIFENEYLPAAFAVDVLEANHRTYEERLASCKMIVSPTDSTPTILGLLALGKSPQDYIPGAYIQFLRVNGTELADEVIDEEDIRGAIVEVLRRTEEKLQAHNRRSVDITSSATHQESRPFPPAALQQILYNAVLHRTYEGTNAPIRVYWFNDRIEITSPGGPYGNVTCNNFGSPGITDYRNPNIADVLKTFGFIQAFGRGIATAKRELTNNGNAPPTFTCTQSAVLCTMRSTS